jgi:pimeloyl-ACP methyl ester carboxylesterase
VGTPGIECVPVAPGVELAVRTWGRGDVARGAARFVLVHGLASNARTWDGVARRLHDLGHAVATVDLRGHGSSAKPDGGYDFATLGGDLLAVLDHLHWAAVVLVGQSTGGNLALAVARRAPRRVARVVGVDGGFIELRARWATWGGCERALAPPPLEGVSRSRLAATMRMAHPDWSDDGIEATLANLEELPDGTVRPWLTRERHLCILRALWEDDPSASLSALDIPVLLVPADSGDEWSRSKHAEVERVARRGRDVQVHWFAPGDHDLHVQHPAELADVIDRWARP